MKITMVYAETLDHESHMRVRVTMPKSWRGGPAGRLLDFAVDTYNAKHGGALESSDWHIEVDHRALGTEDVIDAVLRKGDEIRLRPGAARKAGVVAKRSVVAGDCWKERREAHDAHQVAVFDAAARAESDSNSVPLLSNRTSVKGVIACAGRRRRFAAASRLRRGSSVAPADGASRPARRGAKPLSSGTQPVTM